MYEYIILGIYVLGLIFLLASGTIIWNKIFNLVNKNLPEDQQEDSYCFTPHKYERIKNKYKILFPNNRNLIVLNIVKIATAIFFILFLGKISSLFAK